MQLIQAASQILPTPTDTCHIVGRLVHAGCACCYLMAEEEPLRWQWCGCNLTRMDQLISRYHQVRAWGSIVLFPFLVRWCKVINLGKACWRYSYIETGQVSMNHRIHVNITHMICFRLGFLLGNPTPGVCGFQSFSTLRVKACWRRGQQIDFWPFSSR
jgi:hypothetical protein